MVKPHVELAQRSRSCLPKDEDCDLCPKGHLIKLRGRQSAGSSSVANGADLEPPKLARLTSIELSPVLEDPHKHICSSHPSQEFFVSITKKQWVWSIITTDTGSGDNSTSIQKEPISIQSNVLPCKPFWTLMVEKRKNWKKLICGGESGIGQHEWQGSEAGVLGVIFSCFLFSSSCFLFSSIASYCLFCFRLIALTVHRNKKTKETREHESKRKKLFWNIQPGDVVACNRVYGGPGVPVDIWQVTWRGGKFVRKDRKGIATEDKELEILEKLSHPNIVYGFGALYWTGGNLKSLSDAREPIQHYVPAMPSLFMERMESDLHNVFVIQNGREEKQDFERLCSRPENSLDVLLQIASAMAYMHSVGVVHGDLKSQNILVSDIKIPRDVRRFLVKVADFGDARCISNVEAGFRPPGRGTTGYAAPELLKWRLKEESHELCTSKIDVYSFGCVAYEVLTGHAVMKGSTKKVIEGEKPSHSDEWKNFINRQRRCPDELIKLVESCWELDPKKRPSFSQIYVKLEKCKLKWTGAVRLQVIGMCVCVALFFYYFAVLKW